MYISEFLSNYNIQVGILTLFVVFSIGIAVGHFAIPHSQSTGTCFY